jgi:hypothetical protein
MGMRPIAEASGVLPSRPAPAVPSASIASSFKTSDIPSIDKPFGGLRTPTGMSPKRDATGAFGLGAIPDTKIALTQPESDDEDDSITVKSPGIKADDEEKRRDALDKAKDYKMASDTY